VTSSLTLGVMPRRARSLVPCAAALAALWIAAGCALSLDGLSGGADTDSGPSSADADAAEARAELDGADGDAADGAFLSIDPPTPDVGTSFDLTALGDLDWVQWTKSRVTKCAPCTTRIGALANTGVLTPYGDDPRRFTWTNGAPGATGASREGIYIVDVGGHFDFTVDAGPARAALEVHVDTYYTGATLTAQLDGAGAAQKVLIPPLVETQPYAVKVHFSAPAGAVLHLSWTISADLLAGTDAGGDRANFAVIAATLAAD
jgi:hypothetical protein